MIRLRKLSPFLICFNKDTKMKETVIQFGEGNFLRAFADDFIDEMNKQGLYGGKAVIVKPTPRGNLDKFIAQSCRYHLVIRGRENGENVSKIKEVKSISRCINPYTDYDGFLALAYNPDFRFIISNTTEAGIAFDKSCAFNDTPALSFPGKLTQLLFERYRAGLGGFVLLPCELIDKNGDELKSCVLKYARLWKLDESFMRWIESENTFCNTLVDRIVTGFPSEEADALCKGDLLLDTAEPYHLWAIEGDFENELPLKEAGFNVIWTDDITPLKTRKVRLLNGAHTTVVFPALLAGAKTVGECLEDEDICAFLKHFLFDCALKVVGESEDNKAFANAVIERFSNPYIRHQLTAIALNSQSKFSHRVLPTAQDYKNRFGSYPRTACVSLAAMIYYYKNHSVTDSEEAVEFIRDNSAEDILDSRLFGADISGMKSDVLSAYRMIENGSVREAMKWAIM